MTKQKLTYATNAYQFITPVCHYDQNTLLTRNGQLIQVICIDNIHTLGNQITLLQDIRKTLRDAIINDPRSNMFAFWISCVRSKTDITAVENYKNQFASDLNLAWSQKNTWQSRFANKLYISIVYKHADLSVNNLTSFLNTFNQSIINDFHQNYLSQSILILKKFSNALTLKLAVFNASLLSIVSNQDERFSELQNFFEQILYMQESNLELEKADLSKVLAPETYGVAQDYIELKYSDKPKFCSVIGIKEYQEIAGPYLDPIMQVQAEIIITEVVKFIDQKQAIANFTEIDQMLIYGDDEAAQKAVNIHDMITGENQKFIQQQINISIIEDSYQQMLESVTQVSNALEQIGIVHVVEDIDIEFAFWARLPGNFNFIKRAAPNLLQSIAGFTSLYSLPTGDMQSKWGSYISLLCTQDNTPYYFNFHDQDNGDSIIFSCKNDGRTLLLNLFIAMSSKHNPDVLYIHDSNKSVAFLEVMGAINKNHLQLPNLLIYLNKEQITQWLSFVCTKSSQFSDEEQLLLNDIAQHFLNIPIQDRMLNKIADFDFAKYPNSNDIQERLALFADGAKYGDIKFDKTADVLKITAYDLSFFTDESFKIANYPGQEKLIPEYLNNLEVHRNIRSAILYMLSNIFINTSLEKNSPKILALHNIQSLVPMNNFENLMNNTTDLLKQNNGIVLSSFCLNDYQHFQDAAFWGRFLQKQSAIMVLSGENLNRQMQSILKFSDQEMDILLNLPTKDRHFVLKQYGFLLSIAMNLTSIAKFSKILSLSNFEYEKYQTLKQENLDSNILKILYEKFYEN